MGILNNTFLNNENKNWVKNNLLYKLIDRNEAKKIIINNHYSKKWNDGHFGVINIGIFKIDNPKKCLGVATYGHLNNPKSAFKIAKGIKSVDEVLELNRMWIDDILGKNTESQLISMSFKIIKEVLPKTKIIQTYADGRLGVGTIYKASGFSYYGKTKSWFIRDIRNGEVYHKVNVSNYARPNGVNKVWDCLLTNNYESFEVYTYKYLFFLHRKVKKYCNFKEEKFPQYHKGELKYDFKWPTKESTFNNLRKCFEKNNNEKLLLLLDEYIKN